MECVSYTNEDSTNVVSSVDACHISKVVADGNGGFSSKVNYPLGTTGLKKKRRRGKKYYENKIDDKEESRLQEDIQRSSGSTYGNELKVVGPTSYDSNHQRLSNADAQKRNVPYVKYSKTKSSRSINDNGEKERSYSMEETTPSKESLERRHLYAHEKKTMEFTSTQMDSHSNMDGGVNSYHTTNPINSQMKTLDSLETCNRNNSTEFNSYSNENAHAYIKEKESMLHEEVGRFLVHTRNEKSEAAMDSSNLYQNTIEDAYQNNSSQGVRRSVVNECNENVQETHKRTTGGMNAMEYLDENGIRCTNHSNRYMNETGFCSEEYQMTNEPMYNKSCTQPGFVDKAYSRKSTRNTFSNKRISLKSKTCVANFVSRSGGSTDFKSTLNIQFSKTKMCPYMNTKEKCKRFVSNQCPYAHDESELKPIPNLYKTTMCRNFMNNACFKSKKECNFAHHVEELRFTDEFYKTTLCKFFSSGYCKADSNCRHAHGYEELKLKPSVHLIENNELNETEEMDGEPMGITNYDMGTTDLHLTDFPIQETMIDSRNIKRKDSSIHLTNVERVHSKKNREDHKKQESMKCGSDEDRPPHHYKNNNMQKQYHRNSVSKKEVHAIKEDSTSHDVTSNGYEHTGSKKVTKTKEIRKKHSIQSSRKNSIQEYKNRKEGEKGDFENCYVEDDTTVKNVPCEHGGEEEDIKCMKTKRRVSKHESSLPQLHDSMECVEKEAESMKIENTVKAIINDKTVQEPENELKGVQSTNSIKSGKSSKHKRNVANAKKSVINHNKEVVNDELKYNDSKKINEKDFNVHLKKKKKNNTDNLNNTNNFNNNNTMNMKRKNLDQEEHSMNLNNNDHNFQGMYKNMHLSKMSECGTANMSMSMHTNQHNVHYTNTFCNDMNHETNYNHEHNSCNQENIMNSFQKKNNYKTNRRNYNGNNNTMNSVNQNINFMNNMNYINPMNAMNKNGLTMSHPSQNYSAHKNKAQEGNSNTNYNNRNYRNMNHMNNMSMGNHQHTTHNISNPTYQKFGNFMNTGSSRGNNKQESNHTYHYKNMNMKPYNNNGFRNFNKNGERFEYYGNEHTSMNNLDEMSFTNYKGDRPCMDAVSNDEINRNGNVRTFNNCSYDNVTVKNQEDSTNVMHKKNMEYGNYTQDDTNNEPESLGNTTRKLDIVLMNGKNGRKKKNGVVPKNDSKRQLMQEPNENLSDGTNRKSYLKKNQNVVKNESYNNDKVLHGEKETRMFEKVENERMHFQNIKEHSHIIQNGNKVLPSVNHVEFPTRSPIKIPSTSTPQATTGVIGISETTQSSMSLKKSPASTEFRKNKLSKNKKKEESVLDVPNPSSEQEYLFNEPIKVCSSCYQYIRKESNTPETSSVESSCLHCGQLIKKTLCQQMIELIKPQVQYMLSDVNFYVQCYKD